MIFNTIFIPLSKLMKFVKYAASILEYTLYSRIIIAISNIKL